MIHMKTTTLHQNLKGLDRHGLSRSSDVQKTAKWKIHSFRQVPESLCKKHGLVHWTCQIPVIPYEMMQSGMKHGSRNQRHSKVVLESLLNDITMPKLIQNSSEKSNNNFKEKTIHHAAESTASCTIKKKIKTNRGYTILLWQKQLQYIVW